MTRNLLMTDEQEERKAARYLPSPKEIAAECEQIQLTWSEREKLSRMVDYVIADDQRGWTVPEVRVGS